MVNIIKSTYAAPTFVKDTDISFFATSGVKQGCPAAPDGFYLVTDSALRESTLSDARHNCLLWADDLVIFGETMEEVQAHSSTTADTRYVFNFTVTAHDATHLWCPKCAYIQGDCTTPGKAFSPLKAHMRKDHWTIQLDPTPPGRELHAFRVCARSTHANRCQPSLR